jgi:hypothetical protein
LQLLHVQSKRLKLNSISNILIFIFLSWPRISGPTDDSFGDEGESTTHLNLLFEGKVFGIFRIALILKQGKTSQIHTILKDSVNTFICAHLAVPFGSGGGKLPLTERFEVNT